MFDVIDSELKQANLSLGEFREVVKRLLTNQAIYRKQSAKESEHYDQFLLIQELVTEYLGVLGFRVVHHEQYQYVVCYPPGSDIPGVHNDDTEQSHYKRHLRRNEKIVLIVARYLFEERLREGQLSDDGLAFVDVEKFNHTFTMVSKKPLDKESERDDLLRFLKGLRVVEYKDKEVSDPDSLIGFRSTILCFSMDSVVHQVREELGIEVDDEEEFQPDTSDDFSLELTGKENDQ
jgi:hypothetical protein